MAVSRPQHMSKMISCHRPHLSLRCRHHLLEYLSITNGVVFHRNQSLNVRVDLEILRGMTWITSLSGRSLRVCPFGTMMTVNSCTLVFQRVLHFALVHPLPPSIRYMFGSLMHRDRLLYISRLPLFCFFFFFFLFSFVCVLSVCFFSVFWRLGLLFSSN